MNLLRTTSQISAIGYCSITGGARANFSLNAAFVNATSGTGLGIRYMAQTVDTIDELYVFLDATTGTRGNVTMECSIYNEAAANAARAGTTVRDVSTATAYPASDDMWIKFTFGTPYTPTVGEILWLVIYNTAGAPGTDFPQIMTSNTITLPNFANNAALAFTTSTGFSTNGTAVQETPFVIKQGSNYFGQPFTQFNGAYYTNNQLERGFQFTPTEDVVVQGYMNTSATTSFALARILADATAPGGTAENEYDLDSDANETTNDICGAKIFDAAVTVSGGATHKFTLTYSANSQLPGVIQIEDYATYSGVFDALRAENALTMPWGAIDNGAGGWTIDKAIAPQFALLVQDYPAIAAGGGGNTITQLLGGSGLIG